MNSVRIARLGLAGVAAAAGAGIAFLLDPHSGARRRHRLMDRGAAALRRGRRRAGATARYERGRVVGMVHQKRHHAEVPTDDVVIKQNVHEALHRAGLRTAALTVEVSARVAVLRGEVLTAGDRQLAEEITANVPGVVKTVIYLHLPGEPAPNKLESLRASR